jgi:hypothetical protein
MRGGLPSALPISTRRQRPPITKSDLELHPAGAFMPVVDAADVRDVEIVFATSRFSLVSRAR